MRSSESSRKILFSLADCLHVTQLELSHLSWRHGVNNKCWPIIAHDQNQNQNCCRWHVQMTIIHQDLWWWKLVPSPYKRSELSNRVFCTFSSRKERACKWILISNSLEEETALVNVSISKRDLKCQRVMLSDMPNWGDKVIPKYTGCTLQTR